MFRKAKEINKKILRSGATVTFNLALVGIVYVAFLRYTLSAGRKNESVI